MMDEWTRNFIKKVENMRELQKRFLKTHDRTVMEESKRLEAEVDDLIVISKMPSDISADN